MKTDMSICLIADSKLINSPLKEFNKLNVSYIELRIDSLTMSDLSNLDTIFKKLKNFNKPIIGTIRDPKEGGQRLFSKTEHCALFEKLIHHCALIDIELRNAQKYQSYIKIMRQHGVALILSYHDFKRFPGITKLNHLLLKGIKFKPNYFKFALTLNDASELTKLCDFTYKHKNKSLVTMGMGKFGAISRILLPHFGSGWVYSFLDVPNAPGQLDVHTLVDISNKLIG